jgi:metal-responsive CopG/Arc/MetJ family transcriptional regulator
MPVQQISATVDGGVYQQFEELRVQAGFSKRSEALEEAIKLWIKAKSDALIAEGCRASREDDLAMAKASKKKTLKALSRSF